MEFTALNDDCIRPILACLPSSQLFAICASRNLKNQQIYRCASDILLGVRSPFSIKPAFPMAMTLPLQGHQPSDHPPPDFVSSVSPAIFPIKFKRLQSIFLLDCEDKQIAVVTRPELFRPSRLNALVCFVDLPIDLTEEEEETKTNFWLDLTLNLPETATVSVFFRAPYASYTSCAESWVDRLNGCAAKLRPIFPRVRSFTIPDHLQLESACIAQLFGRLDEMSQLSSLCLPSRLVTCKNSWMLSLTLSLTGAFGDVSSPLPTTATARRLTDLSVHNSYAVSRAWECAPLLERLAEMGCENLMCLELRCDGCRDETPRHLGGGFSLGVLLRPWPKLTQLKLDSACHFAPSKWTPEIICTDFHLVLRNKSLLRASGNLTVILGQFFQLRCLRISLILDGQPTALDDCIKSIFSVASTTAELRELKIDTVASPIFLQRELNHYDLLRDELAWCPKLERADLTGIVFRFPGYPTENPDKTAFGYWHLGPIIKALATNLTLKNVKISANMDSFEAVKSQLPENCYIAKLREIPKPSFGNCYILRPDSYWLPLDISIVCHRKNYGATVADSFSDKLVLRIIHWQFT